MRAEDVRPSNPAALLGSAIRYCGVTYWMRAPSRHGHVIHAYAHHGGTRQAAFGRMEQGFVDKDLNFLDRKQAAAKHFALGGKLHWGPSLYSEDLW